MHKKGQEAKDARKTAMKKMMQELGNKKEKAMDLSRLAEYKRLVKDTAPRDPMRSHHFNRMRNLEMELTKDFYEEKKDEGNAEEFDAIKPMKSNVSYTVLEDQARYDPAIAIIRERERMSKIENEGKEEVRAQLIKQRQEEIE